MAKGPPPKAVIPAGKESEYQTDNQGRRIHMTYGEDGSMPGTVLPTGKSEDEGGGSYGFDVDDMDYPQNIISYDENGMQTITQVTRRELAKIQSPTPDPERRTKMTPEMQALMADNAADILMRLGNMRIEGQDVDAAKQPAAHQLKEALAKSMNTVDPFEGGSMAKKATKKKAKRAKKKEKDKPPVKEAPNETVQHVVESDETAKTTEPPEEVEPQQAEEKVAAPLPVARISGAFGSISATFSSVFRDGMVLVLCSDARQLQSVYELPPVDQPMPLLIEYEDHRVPCLWAGIQFTMPSVPVTFVVLLVAGEEQTDGEGFPGQDGFNDM